MVLKTTEIGNPEEMYEVDVAEPGTLTRIAAAIPIMGKQ